MTSLLGMIYENPLFIAVNSGIVGWWLNNIWRSLRSEHLRYKAEEARKKEMRIRLLAKKLHVKPYELKALIRAIKE